MKKAYQKPMLFAEDFQLYEHISSGSCYINKAAHVQATYTDSSSCQYWDGNIAMFVYGSNCTAEMDMWADEDLGIDPTDPSSFHAACYNAFGDMSFPFVS